MSKTLIVTVGGSHVPVDRAIEDVAPSKVIFVCSIDSAKTVDAPGKPIEFRQGDESTRLASFAVRHKLAGEAYQVVTLDDLDDLSRCYLQIVEAVAPYSAGDLVADYTGGTKSMSAALAMVAVDAGIQLQMIAGPRRNMIKVDREEFARDVSSSAIQAQRILQDLVPRALADYDYSSAEALLRNALKVRDIPMDLRQRLSDLRSWVVGLEAWDRFDHQEAATALEPLRPYAACRPYVMALHRICGGKDQHGYELVEDLLLNAQRRAQRKAYDDAVGRLYRAFELLAQVRLQQEYSLVTSQLRLEGLPESFRTLYPAGTETVQAGLDKAYQLLAALEDAHLGLPYRQRESKIKDRLKIRNYSLFAHGTTPITKEKYEDFEGVLGQFMRDALAQLRPEKHALQQFPTASPL